MFFIVFLCLFFIEPLARAFPMHSSNYAGRINRNHCHLSPHMMYNRQNIAKLYDSLFVRMGRQSMSCPKSSIIRETSRAITVASVTVDWSYIYDLSAINYSLDNELQKLKAWSYAPEWEPLKQRNDSMANAADNYLDACKKKCLELNWGLRKTQHFFDLTVPIDIASDLMNARFLRSDAYLIHEVVTRLKQKNALELTHAWMAQYAKRKI